MERSEEEVHDLCAFECVWFYKQKWKWMYHEYVHVNWKEWMRELSKRKLNDFSFHFLEILKTKKYFHEKKNLTKSSIKKRTKLKC